MGRMGSDKGQAFPLTFLLKGSNRRQAVPTSSLLMGSTTGRLLQRATPKHACPPAWGSCWGGVRGAKPHCKAKQLKRPLLADWTWNSKGSPVLASPDSAVHGRVGTVYAVLEQSIQTWRGQYATSQYSQQD